MNSCTGSILCIYQLWENLFSRSSGWRLLSGNNVIKKFFFSARAGNAKKTSSLISAMGCYKRPLTLNHPKKGPFTRTTHTKPTKMSDSTAPTHTPLKNIPLAHTDHTQSKNGHTYSHLPKEGHTNPNTPTITPQKLTPLFYHLYLQGSIQPEQTWILCILQIQFPMQKTDPKH